jgi:hypothetical protein
VKTSFVRVVHLSPRTTQLTVRIDDKQVADKIKYQDKPGSYTAIEFKKGKDVTVKVSQPGGEELAKATRTVEDKFKYTVFVYDTLDAGKKVKFMLLKDTFDAPGAGKTNVRFLHLAPQTASVRSSC